MLSRDDVATLLRGPGTGVQCIGPDGSVLLEDQVDLGSEELGPLL